jgi:hypothetical protein
MVKKCSINKKSASSSLPQLILKNYPFVMLLTFSLFAYTSIASAEIQISNLDPVSFAGNDVDSKGTLWVGDKDFNLYKSVDNGATFQKIYRLPGTYEPYNYYSGVVWNVFVDSRDYIFASAGGTGALFRSTDGGASFTQVLKTNGTTNESFYISMTQDEAGSLYVVTYTNGRAIPYLLKSVDGGSNWVRVGNFSVVHFHAIKFNPYNRYLYVIMGEGNMPEAARILRSKDGGASWSLVVKRNDAIGTVYLAIAFKENAVYVGQDYPNRFCQIHKFIDNGSDIQFEPQVVYSPPNDGCMPFMSAVTLGETLIFANSAEVFNGVSRVVASVDGSNWTVIKNQTLTCNPDNRWNFLTTHPRNGIVYGTIKTGESYKIIDVPPPPPPTPEPTSYVHTSMSSNVVSKTTPRPSKTPTPTRTPTPTPTVTPMPTTTAQPTNFPSPTTSQAVIGAFKIDQYVLNALIAVAITCSVAVITVLFKKRKNSNHK